MNLRCSKCGKSLKAPDEAAGKLCKCPACGHTFTLPSKPPSESPAVAASVGRAAEKVDQAKTGNWSPGEKVPKTGTYKCLYCGPDGMGARVLKHAMKSMGIPYSAPPFALKTPPQRFLKEGESFPSCPTCKNDPSGLDTTGWEFVSEKEVKTTTTPGTDMPDMVYFECTRPPGDGTCSDDSCPCGYPGANIPRGSGYVYISKELVEMRRDALSIAAISAKVLKMQQRMGATILTATSGVFMPIVMCEQGAKKRGIDLAVAAADAKHWWETGLAPLRPTPMAGKGSSGCFIATACYGSADCVEVMEFRRFRDEVLVPSWLGRQVVHLYYRLSPPIAALLRRKPILRAFVKRCFLTPAFKALRRQ